MISNLDYTADTDYEFIGFIFDNRHCSEFKLTVVSPSGMNSQSLFADFEDKIVEVSGKDGAYYFGTKIKTKPISISLAFDNLTSADKRAIITWLTPNNVAKIIFDEAPYKYYWVKVARPPIFSFVPFEEDITNGKQHIFKGTLTIDFIAVDPYGYSDYALTSEVPIFSGNISNWATNKPYNSTNIPGWLGESGLHSAAPGASDPNYPLPTPKPNSSTGYTSATGILTPNFYNGGDAADPIYFKFTVGVFDIDADPIQFKNTTQDPDEVFELKSLNNLTALSEQTAGTWTITCDPSKCLVSAIANSGTTIYNLGSLHNGTFLKAYPGNNTLTINKTITNLTLKYKYKYW
ncbi:MAG: phage tail family protein [Bacteroidia bacterium]|nr:phage tail family protein [Bacteroidia bacterium]